MDQISISEGLLYFDDFPAGEKWKNISYLLLSYERILYDLGDLQWSQLIFNWIYGAQKRASFQVKAAFCLVIEVCFH